MFRIKSKVFYGWIVVVACMLISACVLGIYNSIGAVTIKQICSELNFTRGAFTLHRTIATLSSAVFLPFTVKIIERFGTKKLMVVSAIAMFLITIGYSFSTKLWHFYILSFIFGFFTNGGNFMILGIIINKWFVDKKAVATAFAYAGSGVGSAISFPIANKFLEIYNWQRAYQIMGIIGIIILLPAIIFLIKEKPEDINLKPYRQDTSNKIDANNKNKQINLYEKQIDIFKTPMFYLLAIALFFISVAAGGSYNHTSPYLTDIGYTPAYAANIMSLLMISLTVGKIALGTMYDKLGTKISNLILGICTMTFPIFAMLSTNKIFTPVFAILCGIASCGFSIPVSTLINKHFLEKDFARIFTLLTVITTLGSAFSSPIVGVLYDWQSKYDLAWILLIITGGISLVLLLATDILPKARQKNQSI